MVLHRSMLIWRGSICQGYICILLDVKLIGCKGVAEMYVHLEKGWGQSAIGICAFFFYVKLMRCNGFA